ncbi:hypothetical protein D5S18_28145 [Nocardia panacis]|uniref:Uncharacterized protein n=1 Tax=Nocardia panacis TaxID=2340916 RepID=A0A3A4JUC5_9NOCA|nr:hypothetical protein [Nocardia panacis]RJO69775.1 hypothetical protein D5S18_28145 [Nocardia panacis]
MSDPQRNLVLTYATVDQLAEHVTAAQLDKLADSDAARYIREATQLVRTATKNDMYDVTPAGVPTDPILADALAIATCIQVREWIRNDINPLAGAAGLTPTVASASTNGSSVSYISTEQAVARARLLTELTDTARTKLRSAGLASAMVARR